MNPETLTNISYFAWGAVAGIALTIVSDVIKGIRRINRKRKQETIFPPYWRN